MPRSPAFSPSPLVLGAIDLGRELAERGQRAVEKEVDMIEGMYTKPARWGRNNGAVSVPGAAWHALIFLKKMC